jgi:hypothetical protein
VGDGFGAAELAEGPGGLEPDVVRIVPERGQDGGDDVPVPDLAQDLQGAAAAPGGAPEAAARDARDRGRPSSGARYPTR